MANTKMNPMAQALSSSFTPQPQIQHNLSLANVLQQQALQGQPSTFALAPLANLFNGINAGMTRNHAFNSLQQNQDAQNQTLTEAANAPDNMSMAKALSLSPDPNLQRSGVNMISQQRRADAAAERANRLTPYQKAMLALKRKELSGSNQPQYTQKTMPDGSIVQTDRRTGAQKFLRKGNSLSPSEMKHLYKAEDDIPAFKSAIENLKRAKAILKKTHTGLFPETRASAGAYFHDLAVPDRIASPESSNATKEYAQIMGLQTFQTMSELLKGAMSDREMAQFQKIIGDTSAPHEVRERAINRLLSVAEHQMRVKQRRVQELRTGVPKPPSPAPGQLPNAPTNSGQPANEVKRPPTKVFNPATGRLEVKQ